MLSAHVEAVCVTFSVSVETTVLSAQKAWLCVSYDPHDQQPILPNIALTNWSLRWTSTVICVKCEQTFVHNLHKSKSS
jgi:hypothetical protein